MKYPLRYPLLLPAVGLLCLVACVLRTVACLTALDGFGYFPASALPEASAYILLGAALIALLLPLFHKEPAVRPLLPSHPLATLPTGMLALCEVLLCTADAMARREAGAPLSAQPPMLRAVSVLLLVLGLIGAAYYVLCLAKREQVNEARAWCGMAAVLFCALYAVYLYFNTALPLNATTKITSQVAFLTFAVYLLQDVRLSLGKPCYRLHLALTLIAASVAAYAALPALITYAVRGTIIDHTLFETLFTLCFLLFALARLYALWQLPSDEPCTALLPCESAAAGATEESAEADEQTAEAAVGTPTDATEEADA